ncbi:glutaredoxin [Ruegeria phage RpAliso]|nr:glutaredoxin [Ruegeria phage RpAliso]
MFDFGDIGFTIIRGTFPCKWCDKAEDLLKEKGHSVEVQKLSMATLIERQAEQKHPTVPMIYHGVHFIGGFSELEGYLN